MKTYTIYREQYLPITIETAWAFFSDARNLAAITPPEMNFVILDNLDDNPVYTGMKINYIIKPLLQIPLKWTTEIKDVSTPYYFVDVQLKGPYALWEHAHTFKTIPGGIHMTDRVRYSLPFGVLGNIAHYLVVKQKLENIFNFRHNTLTKLFGTMENPGS